ncbi:MAG: TonB-dependent receptor [Bdellovibrionales bacterium]|nr:TonB-dependent receptor [Bdellovibrionales bacterium]
MKHTHTSKDISHFFFQFIKFKLFRQILFFFLTFPLFVQAQEILVEAPKINWESLDPSPSKTVISSSEIEKKGSPNVSSIIRDVPGVEMVQSGGLGQNTTLFMRGSRTEDTLVLIDGIPANDAISTAGGFDFSALSSINIDRIEVLPGPQSVRFGSGSMGGVINIITKKGERDARGKYLLEAGSYQTLHTALSGGGGNDLWGASFGLDRITAKGFSAASGKENPEKDGVAINSLSTQLDWKPKPLTQLHGNFRYANAQTDIDSQGGPQGDDPNDTSKKTQMTVGFSGEQSLWKQQWLSHFGYYYSQVDRKTENLPDPENTFYSKDHYFSQTQKFQWDHKILAPENHLFHFGVEWLHEKGDSQSTFTSSQIEKTTQALWGEFLSYSYNDGSWFYDTGIRLSQRSNNENITSYQSSVGKEIASTGTRLSLSYGTGFKMPSLYQTAKGESGLQHEHSSTYEATAVQKLHPLITGRLTYFKSEFKNLIGYNENTTRYYNIAKAHSEGPELQILYKYQFSWSATASYSYLKTRDNSTGYSLLRRPQHSGSLSINYDQFKYNIFIDYRFRGSRQDLDSNSQRVTLPTYDLVSLGGTWKYSKKLHFLSRIENLFNKNYEEIKGYSSPLLSFYFALKGEI